jgi:ribonuclease HI
MAKKQFYAVVKGRKPGIYDRWSGSGGAQDQVSGFPGAKYQGFVTRQEAETFLRSGGAAPAQPALFQSSAVEQAASKQPAAVERTSAEFRADLATGKVVIFTDGASTGNPGPGGYGIVLLSGEGRQELSGGFRCTTNNRMELMGVIAALQGLQRPAQVVLYSDSRYVVDGIQKGWARRWRSRGWMRDAENRAENTDLWAQLLDLLDQHKVEFRWVRGHASHPENERCDRLAVEAAHQKNLPEDAGFTTRC